MYKFKIGWGKIVCVLGRSLGNINFIVLVMCVIGLGKIKNVIYIYFVEIG